MTLDDYLRIGVTVPLGGYDFTAEKIKAFAAKYDPQRFHMDEKEAESSVFGRLCASGWQTAAAWMKCNLTTPVSDRAWIGPGPEPVFGPSPGFSNMKWPKPVYAGETVSYNRTVLSHRPMTSRPGWRLVSLRAEGSDSTGDKVIEFDSAVLVQAD